MTLNLDQQAVVEATEGEIALLAGPGSGKTRVLIARYQRLLKMGVSKKDILAVTFTKESAGVMESRAGTAGNFMTFHSYGYSVIAAERGRPPFEPELRHRLLAGLSKRMGVDYKGLAAYISHKRHAGIAPLAAIEEAPRSEYKISQAYHAYETERLRAGWIGFDDMICDAVALLENREVRARHQWRYVMADEMQDTDPLQVRLLRLISMEYRNVLAVGDPGQAIYAFRGASPEILTNFTKFFDQGRYMYLGMGYRSTQTITDYVRKHYPLDISLKEQIRAARTEKGVAIDFQMFNGDMAESESAVISANRAPVDSAILSRTNRGLAFAESYCRRNSIAYTLLGKSGFFKKPEVIKAVDKLKPYRRLSVAQAFSIVMPAIENFYRVEDSTPEDNVALENVKTLREIANDFPNTEEFVDFANKAAHAKRQKKGITLSTVHQAKGCEWANVYVIGVSHGMMPHKNALEVEGGLLEEARVFMVAVSRPKDYLRISFTGMPGSFLRLDLSVEDIVRLQNEAGTRTRPVEPTQGGLF